MNLWVWFLHVTGADNVSGAFYGFWSGFGSDIGEFALLGGVIALYRKHNCHAPKCWRIGKHTVDGTPYVVCKHHHPGMPTGKVTMEHIQDAYRRAQKRHDHD